MQSPGGDLPLAPPMPAKTPNDRPRDVGPAAHLVTSDSPVAKRPRDDSLEKMRPEADRPDANVPDADTTEERPQRTFRFREDFTPPAKSVASKAPGEMAIPDPPKSTSPIGRAPEDLEAARSPSPEEAATARRSAVLRQWLFIAGAAIVGVSLALIVFGILAARTPGVPDKSSSVASAPDDGQAAKTNEDSAADRGSNEPAVDKGPPSAVGDSEKGASSQPTAPTADASTHDQPSSGGASKADTPDNKVPATDDAAQANIGDAPPGRVPQSGPDDSPPMTDAGSNDAAAPAVDNGTSPPADHPPGNGIPGDGVEVPAQLSLAIPGVAFENVSVADFADFVADFTTLPVTLDLDAMLVAGLSAETKLGFQLRGVTVEQMLKEALEPKGLALRVEAGQIVISAGNATDTEIQQRTYDVSDLAASDDETARLANNIIALIAPHSWVEAGGQGTSQPGDQTLEVDQTAAVHFQIARCLDRLRTARGLLPRSDLPAELIDAAPLFLQAAGELNSPVSVNFSDPVKTELILDYLRAETDVTLLVDWREVSKLGWLPSTKSTLSVIDEPLHTLLDQWLSASKLGYRVVDARTIQISSHESIAARPEFELYPLKNTDNVESLISAAKTHLGDGLFTSAGGIGAILFDPESHCLLVSLPQPGQRRLAEWLMSTGKMGTRSEEEAAK